MSDLQMKLHVIISVTFFAVGSLQAKAYPINLMNITGDPTFHYFDEEMYYGANIESTPQTLSNLVPTEIQISANHDIRNRLDEVKFLAVRTTKLDRVERQKTLQNNWENCLKNYARAVAVKNSDPAEIVVRAAFVTCSNYEDALYHFFEGSLQNTSNMKLKDFTMSWLTVTFFPAIKRHYSDVVIATVLSARSK